MAEHIRMGADGEQLALDFLIKKGYQLLETNYKAEGCEIDIIARDGKVIVFAEVKTRSNAMYGWPEESVTEAKQERIARAAECWLEEKGMDEEIRFDIVSVLQQRESVQVYHIRDAFAP